MARTTPQRSLQSVDAIRTVKAHGRRVTRLVNQWRASPDIANGRDLAQLAAIVGAAEALADRVAELHLPAEVE
jgi:hypothetical protein